jgi:hypothetical protein
MDRPAHRRTSPVAHLTDDFLLVVIVRLVWETCPELMFVKNLCLRVGNTYIFELDMNIDMVVKTCEICGFCDICGLYYVFDDYVISVMFMWWLCDISFVCLDGIE